MLINKKRIIFFTKLVFSISLLYLAYQNTTLNAQVLITNMTNWQLTGPFLLITFTQMLLGAKRTSLLIHWSDSQRPSFIELARINWASSFVSFASPFNFVGDLFKISSLRKYDSTNSHDYSVHMSIYSKVLSTLALFFISTVAYFINTNTAITFGEKFKDLSLLSLSILLVLWFFRLKLANIFCKLGAWLISKQQSAFIRNRIKLFLDYNYLLFKGKLRVLLSITLSLVIQLLNCFSIYLIIIKVEPQAAAFSGDLATLIPIGLFAQLLPISYSGLGVGHIAFDRIMQTNGFSSGADIFTIYFSLSLVFNLLGIIPFILSYGPIIFKKRKTYSVDLYS